MITLKVLDRKTKITATGGSSGSGFGGSVRDGFGNSRTTITHYEGDVVFATDYYPFGNPISWSTPDSSSGRMYSGSGYRYGFNGKEKDNEVQGDGNTCDYGFRIYNPRLGKFLSVDPHASNYPGMSPYSAMGNNPISFIDPDGRDIVYFNTMGQETHRVKSTTEFRTYIQSTATIQHPTKSMSGWKEVPMPNIIQERTQSGENVSGSAYQENDYLIAARTGLFNHTKNNGKLQLYTEKGVAIPKDEASKIPDLDPTLVKSIAIQESHNGTTGVADIMTANNTGDFDPYKSAYGLTKGETMDVNRSLYLGIRFLATKGFRGGITYDKKTGEKTYTFQGWFNAAGNYNGGGVKGYQGYVEEMFNNSRTPTSNDY